MSVRRRAFGASAAVITAIGATVIAWPGTSGAAVTPQAVAPLVNASGVAIGTVTFLGNNGHTTRVDVDLDLPLPSGDAGLNAYHGLHIHAGNECVAPFTTAGGHWDDGTHTHGQHLGDLPSPLVDSEGEASLRAATHRFDVEDIVGRTVILHAGRDNFGNVPRGSAADQYTENSASAVTLTNNTGNAGSRYGCGVIQLEE